MRVTKRDHSPGVRSAAEPLREMGAKEGDRVELEPADNSLSVRRHLSAEEVLEHLRRYRGRLPAAQTLTRDSANGR